MASTSSQQGPPRQELISSAISFLSDPKVQSSSIAQRIAFLESKGLTSPEIDEALRQSGMVGGGTSGQQQQQQPYQQQQQRYYGQQQGMGGYYGPQVPPTAGRDWRDWFIMAVVSGAVGYGVIAMAKVRETYPWQHTTSSSILMPALHRPCRNTSSPTSNRPTKQSSNQTSPL